MSKKTARLAVLLAMLVSVASLSAGADPDVLIDTFGATPFVYEGRSYLPLKSAAGFLGAPVVWEPARNRAVVSYQGQQLSLTPWSRHALLGDQPMLLSAAPLIGEGRLFVPLDALRQAYGVPVEWDQAHSRVRIMGATGWGAVTMSRRPPGWVRGRKTGWAKHGDAALPPGLSRKQGSRSAVVVPRNAAGSHKVEKSSGVEPRAVPGPPPRAKAGGRRGR